MPKIFVSYAKEDIDLVRQIMAELRGLGFDYWMDKKDLESGDIWPEEITRAISSCNIFLLFMSIFSMDSDSVQREVQIAYEKKKKIIILRLDAVDTPNSLKFQLARIQWTDYGPDWRERLTRALRSRSRKKPVRKSDDGTNRIVSADELFGHATRLNLMGDASKALQLYRQVKEIDQHYPGIDWSIYLLENEIKKGIVGPGGIVLPESLLQKVRQEYRDASLKERPISISITGTYFTFGICLAAVLALFFLRPVQQFLGINVLQSPFPSTSTDTRIPFIPTTLTPSPKP